MLPAALPARRAAFPSIGPRLPTPRRLLGLGAAVGVLAIVSTVVSTFGYLRVPAPTGDLAVGRVETLLVDQRRMEPATRGGGQRAVPLVAWYPAVPGTGSPAQYVPGYEEVRGGLEASGELSAPVVAALRLVGTASRAGAEPAAGTGSLPVIVLTPGNATNVAFYATLAEDLASRGYLVVGVDHPYHSTAVVTGPGHVAVAEEAGSGADAITARINERVADLSFVLDRLAVNAAGLPGLDGRLDLDRIGVVGHSNGGLAAVRLCGDVRVAACANIDGQSAGGPFGTEPDPVAPEKPFLFLTKETSLHPALAEVFERAGTGAYRVVVPAATHQAFADGARFEPRILPVDGTADHVLTIERGFVGAFFETYLRGADPSVFTDLVAPTDVYVEGYPLGERPPLP